MNSEKPPMQNIERVQAVARELQSISADPSEQPTEEMPAVTPEMMGSDSGSFEATDSLLVKHILGRRRN